jgi:hypothetical protein
MAFQPVLPLTGYAGWAFLERTLGAQKTALAGTAEAKRDDAYFREKIGGVKTAEQLVGDRRLLKVALSAFGLEADIDSKAFIRKVLEGGTLNTGALANRLADKRYAEFSRTFGFGDFTTPSTQLSDFADKILARYRDKAFESAVGAQNGSYRLALNAQSELAAIAGRSASDGTKWYSILASRPLREVFQTAFGLPSSFALIDVDKQRQILAERAGSILKIDSPADFGDPATVERLVRLYLVRADSSASGGGAAGGGGAALQLLAQGQQSLAALKARR